MTFDVGRTIYLLPVFPTTVIAALTWVLFTMRATGTFSVMLFIDVLFLGSYAYGLYLARMRRSSFKSRLSLDQDSVLVQRAGKLAMLFKINHFKIYTITPHKAEGVGIRLVSSYPNSIWIFKDVLDELSLDEQQAIIAHEFAHWSEMHSIKRAMLSLLYTLAGIDLALFPVSRIVPRSLAVPFLLDGLSLLIVGNLFLVQFFRRICEFKADEMVSQRTEYGPPLASALTKMRSMSGLTQSQQRFRWKRWRASYPAESERVRRILQSDNHRHQSKPHDH